jgi:putative N-acetyltransferase (TIGR04045 family)
MLEATVTPFTACHFKLKYASEPWEWRGAARLRHSVFCDEQKIFTHHDRDDIDAVAIHLVALSTMAVLADEVVGTVRIHQEDEGHWFGSRLAVARPYRRIGVIGTALIRHAVSSAHTMGCQRFFAHVQAQNEPLFRRLSWHRLEEVDLHGRLHVLMEADLAAYPPLNEPALGFDAVARTLAA